MADTAPAATPKKAAKTAKAKKPRTKPNHPKTSAMVLAAIKSLNERGGSSLQAIKKYISATYKIDADKLAPFIKRYLKSAVVDGTLTQTKGKGATGSFKIGGKSDSAAPKKKAAAKKPKKAAAKPAEGAVKKSPAKKAKKPKTPKKAAAAKPKKAAAKKAAKSPKKPKPKKASKPKAKKAAAKKK